jgi:hypothetical protein
VSRGVPMCRRFCETWDPLSRNIYVVILSGVVVRKTPLRLESIKPAYIRQRSAMPKDSITISPGPQFRVAMLLAIVADALQLIVFPVFVEGALSPADDVLDLGIAAMMVHLLGWHWEFLPSFLAKLVPGVDLVPFWTIAVANVWRKTKHAAAVATTEKQPFLERNN